MMLSKAVLALLVITALLVDVLAAPISLRARAEGNGPHDEQQLQELRAKMQEFTDKIQHQQIQQLQQTQRQQHPQLKILGLHMPSMKEDQRTVMQRIEMEQKQRIRDRSGIQSFEHWVPPDTAKPPPQQTQLPPLQWEPIHITGNSPP